MKRSISIKCTKNIFVFTFSFILLLHSFTLEAVSLQLKWTHAFQFAGYYAALEKGYYRDAGLEVEIRESGPDINPSEEVLSGRATYGIGTSGILLERAKGKPLVVLSVIFQHSALALAARMDNPSQTIHDLYGRSIMLERQSEELQIYLAMQGLPEKDLSVQEHSLSLMDIVNGKVDAMSIYTTSEPYFLDKMQFHYFLYTPRSIGIDFYGDNLFTTEKEITVNPQRTKAFRAASLRGWTYALEHQEEIIDLILNKYSKFLSRDFLLYEAEHMIPLIRPDLVELGYMNKGRWKHIADTYADQGMIEHNFNFEDFIYEPNPTFDPRGLYVTLIILLLFIFIITTVSFYISRVNIQLKVTMDKYKTAVQSLAESEKKYRYIAENSSDVIWVLDIENSHFLYISPSVKKLRVSACGGCLGSQRR